jgi:hypothetical protein
MANYNTGKRGLQTGASLSRGRGITLSAGIRHRLTSKHILTYTSNAAASDKTKRKASRHSENRTNTVLSQKSVGRLGPPTVGLNVKQVPFATLYTLLPDGGLQMGSKHVEAW